MCRVVAGSAPEQSDALLAPGRALRGDGLGYAVGSSSLLFQVSPQICGMLHTPAGSQFHTLLVWITTLILYNTPPSATPIPSSRSLVPR